MNRHTAARVLSIVGHPVLVVPAAVVGTAVNREASASVLGVAAGAALAVAVATLAYSYLRVRSGEWAHVDASRPAERVQLNIFLVAALLVVAALATASSQPRGVTVGALVCAALVGGALLVRHWLTLSLHLSFAAVAAVLWWPNYLAVLLMSLLGAGVAWSRLVLRRHTSAEVVVGAVVGVAAGIAFRVLAVTP